MIAEKSPIGKNSRSYGNWTFLKKKNALSLAEFEEVFLSSQALSVLAIEQVG